MDHCPHTGITGGLFGGPVRFGCYGQGAKSEQREGPTGLADSSLAVEDRAWVLENDKDRGEGDNRQRDEQ